MTRMPAGWRFVAALAMALYIMVAVPIFGLAGLLLVHGQTSQGRLFSVAVILGLAAPVVAWFALYVKRKRGTLIAAAVLGLSALSLLAIDYGLTPDGLPLTGSPVRSCYTGATAYRRASAANLVPEIDQLLLGTYVMPSLDPLMDTANTRELRGQILAVYGEMRGAPEFECLGSFLDQTYWDFLGKRSSGHFYEYIPIAATDGRLPVVIFLHGSLGNFRGYLWVWKRIADQYGCAIVSPTFGSGNWDQPGGEEAIDETLRYCAAHPRMDSSRIYLVGLSNGGRGVCLGTRRSPHAYRGLVFISPVLAPQALLTDSFVAAWKDKPMLILHGASDNRIPVGYITDAVESLQGRILHVECEIYEGQTHFLFFSGRDTVGDKIGTWLMNH